jgi:hypothetical protein
MYVDSGIAKKWPQYSSALKMEVAYSSEMLLPIYKPTRRQHETITLIHVNTSMINLNLSKILDSEFMELQDSSTQRLKDTKENQKNTGNQGNNILTHKLCGSF